MPREKLQRIEQTFIFSLVQLWRLLIYIIGWLQSLCDLSDQVGISFSFFFFFNWLVERMVIKQESHEQLPSDPASALQGMSTTLYSMLPCLSRCLPNQNSASARPKIKKLDQMFILQRTVYITFLLCVATKSMSSSVIGFFLFELSKLQSHTQNMIVPIFVLGAQNVWRGTGWIAMTCKPSNRVNDKVIFENICLF